MKAITWRAAVGAGLLLMVSLFVFVPATLGQSGCGDTLKEEVLKVVPWMPGYNKDQPLLDPLKSSYRVETGGTPGRPENVVDVGWWIRRHQPCLEMNRLAEVYQREAGTGLRRNLSHPYGDASRLGSRADEIIAPDSTEWQGTAAVLVVRPCAILRATAYVAKNDWLAGALGPGRPGKPELAEKNREVAILKVREAANRLVGAIDLACAGGERKPIIFLDRREAPRFSAIRLTGSGFQNVAHVNIMLNGRQVLQVEKTSLGGLIPSDTWIWIPDSAPFGVTKIWAEEGGTGRKSPELEITVPQLTREQVVANLDHVLKLYFERIPRNDRWHGWFRSGRWRNAINAAGFVLNEAPLWLTSFVFSELSREKSPNLWQNNNYTCSWYQDEVIKFLQGLRFHEDPRQRAIVDGLDYGPFVSGPINASPVSHYFVFVWPHRQAMGQGGGLEDWKTMALSLDPWPLQAPDVFEPTHESGNWAKDSAHVGRWRLSSYIEWVRSSYWYLGPRPENFGYFRDYAFPVQGAVYYPTRRLDPKKPEERPSVYPSLDYNTGQPPPKAVVVHSPVRLEIADAERHRAGMSPDGKLYNDIPFSDVFAVPEPQNRYQWYVLLPLGRYEITIIGTDTGKFQLRYRLVGQKLQEFPPVGTAAGKVSRLTLDDSGQPATLRTDGGEVLASVAREGSLLEPPRTEVAGGAGGPDGRGGRPQGAGQGNTVTIQVPAGQAWTATGVTLRPGQAVRIEAEGLIEASHAGDTRTFYHQVPPEGRTEFLGHLPQRYLPALMLIGRIGNGQVVPVGSFVQSLPANTAYGTGELFLGINDENVADNSGAWTVRITVFEDAAVQPSTTPTPLPVRPDPRAGLGLMDRGPQQGQSCGTYKLSTKKSLFAPGDPGEAIEFSWDTTPKPYSITIAPKGSPDTQFLTYHIPGGPQGNAQFQMPLSEGPYELRLYIEQGQTVASCRVFIDIGIQYLVKEGSPPVAARPAQPPAVATPPPAPAGCVGFRGKWATRFGPVVMSVVGNQATGDYVNYGGRVTGVVSGNVLNGEYSVPDGRRGRFQWTLSADGQAIMGAYEEYNNPSNKGPWDATCSGPVVGAVTPPFAQPQKPQPPPVVGSPARGSTVPNYGTWQQCETWERQICGTWTWDATKQQFNASWGSVAVAVLKLEQFDQNQVVLSRFDPSDPVNGMRARYVGKRNGNVITGTVTWNRGSSAPWSGTWQAQIQGGNVR